jgi:UPF0176 protein
MAALHNKISQKELKVLLFEETQPRRTLSFYRYFPISNPAGFRDQLYKSLHEFKVFGRIYIAQEGINAQVSVPEIHFDLFRDFLNSIEGLQGLRLNNAVDDDGKSFWVLKIKVRNKIVADGIQDPSFNMDIKGKYLDPEQFNIVSGDPRTRILDMRNHYEYEVGHFENAIEVPSDTFREQLEMSVDMLKNDKDQQIVMYCTGGIRCEKASAFMLHHGFKNVYHLEGGIINYANQVKERGLVNKFMGKNFVFDNRLGERVGEKVISRCHQCGEACDRHVNCINEGCHLLFIQCDSCAEKYEKCCSPACQDFIHLPLEDQKKLRSGLDKGRNIFNKSKHRLKEAGLRK